MTGNNIKYFDSFGAEYAPKEIKEFIRKKIITNIYRIQAYDSIVCGYFCLGFIDFMLKGKSLLDYITFFFFSWLLEEWENNTTNFSIRKIMKDLYCGICGKYRKFKNPKTSYILEKNIIFFYHLQ